MMNMTQAIETLENYIYDVEADADSLDHNIEYERGYEDALRTVIRDLRQRVNIIKTETQIETARPLALSDIVEIH